jgi:hypothetical protein
VKKRSKEIGLNREWNSGIPGWKVPEKLVPRRLLWSPDLK